MDCELLLLTLGSKGMTLYDDKGYKTIATKARKVYDVSGAGDTVIAALSLAIAKTNDIKFSAEFANTAAACVVRKTGTATITIDEINNYINQDE